MTISGYTIQVQFSTRTMLGVIVRDHIRHVDRDHANRWIKGMGSKIWNVDIQPIK